MDNLAGKVAVVTGGASGIGLALARRFGREGMKVVIGDVQPDALEEAGKELGAELGEDNVLAVVTDVRDPASVDALAAATFEQFETAHLLCNNAGIGTGGLSWEIPIDRWRWIVEVNLLGVVHGIRSFVPRMVEQGEGHVVNTASVAGFITAPGMSAYCATKHAVVALTESLYLELQVMAGGTVGASVLCPEWVRTQIGNPERLRPDDVSPLAPASAPAATTDHADNPDSEAGPGMQSVVQALVDSGIEPAEVADKVLDAVTAGRFWIFTHETSLAAAKRRWVAVEADAAPVFWGG